MSCLNSYKTIYLISLCVLSTYMYFSENGYTYQKIMYDSDLKFFHLKYALYDSLNLISIIITVPNNKTIFY